MREKLLRWVEWKSDQFDRLMENLWRYMKLRMLKMLKWRLIRWQMLILLMERLGKELSKQMLIEGIYVLVRLMLDDFTGNVDKRDVVSLSNVEDGVAGAVGESSHADVQAVIATFNVVDGELGKQVCDVRRCEQSQMNLLSGRLWVLLPEKSDHLEPALDNRKKA